MTLALACCEIVPAPTPAEKHVCKDVCLYCKKCTSACTDEVCKEKCTCTPLEVTHTSWKMLEGTDFATDVHKFVTNKQGPAVVIMGGTHGDETAGWNAGLALVDENSQYYIGKLKGLCGTILVIPQCNIIADTNEVRYKVSGYQFSDLNRSFPTDTVGTVKSDTATISSAILGVVDNFIANYDVQCIIDMHEAQHSWSVAQSGPTTTSLGDTLIFSNLPFEVRNIIKHYNAVYRPENEPAFMFNEATQKGSFNYHYTHKYPDKIVYTIETNREVVNGKNTIQLETRVRQQIKIIQATFDYLWGLM